MEQSRIARLGGARSVAAFTANIVVSLALIAVLPIMVIWPFGGSHHPTVEVHDEAGVLQTEPLIEEIQAMRFRDNVHVAVLTVPGWDVDNLNDAVLEYARSHASDTDVPWISTSNPNYWSDGLVILAVAPEARKVGCYFGEDVAVPLKQQAAIQDAAKNQYRQADWYGGTVSMATKTADVIGRPGGGDEATTYVLPLIWACIGLVWLLYYLWRGFTARSRAHEALRHYSQVTHDYETTELLAGTIPEDEPHGAQVMARYRWFRSEYEKVTRSWQDFGSPYRAQWFGMSVLRRATELEKRSALLDSLDDVIANTATFLGRSPGWDRVWANEQGPVLEDLQSLRRLCHEIDSSDAAESGSIAEHTKEEREWVRSRKQRLDDMTSSLEDGSLQPSAVLDELDEIASETKTKAARLAREAIDADTSSYADERRRRYDSRSSKEAAYAGYWYLGGGHGSYNPHSTIRLNPSSPAISAIGSSSSGAGAGGSYSSFTPISDLVVGYSSASSYTPPSSSGSGSSFSGGGFSGGYSGGGGFSGSGSSSSF
ncbi:hypothetical protein HMPREF0975_02591 [Actinomyces sp. oral taxon 849 str. F0330]|uniref:DUF5129 domain-containing protein n=1 Tax=Actinomyces sp. oral taxon 849 TaxID=653385 RepID=UPI0002430297|nr:DUF5129 domain-containing protein [Actinomyces sp. oral taxon 849]EHM91024.1 hypothetical protein HMPREF0975_02591 [Actinomyces sp. oral taxon 849 str. F0330]